MGAAPAVQTGERPKPRTLRLYDTIEALDILDDLIAEHADRIAASGGDIESIPEIAELLAFAEDQFEGSVERWALKIRSLLAEAIGAQVELDRLTILVRSKQNAAQNLKDYLKRMLEARNVQKMQFTAVRVRIQKNSAPSVRAASEGLIEELYASGSEFIKRKETFDLDREKILEAQKNGEELPDGILISKGTHLRVE